MSVISDLVGGGMGKAGEDLGGFNDPVGGPKLDPSAYGGPQVTNSPYFYGQKQIVRVVKAEPPATPPAAPPASVGDWLTAPSLFGLPRWGVLGAAAALGFWLARR